jgi:hypothetical protein
MSVRPWAQGELQKAQGELQKAQGDLEEARGALKRVRAERAALQVNLAAALARATGAEVLPSLSGDPLLGGCKPERGPVWGFALCGVARPFSPGSCTLCWPK